MSVNRTYVRVNYVHVIFALILSIVNFVSLGESLKHKGDGVCVQTGCLCRFPNGKVLDLSHHVPVVSSINITGQTNLTIIFHPCKDVNIGNATTGNDCFAGASICLQNFTDNTTFRLGQAGKGAFDSVDSTPEVTVKYTGVQNQITTLHLLCSPDAKETITATSTSPNKYDLYWTTSTNATCPLMASDAVSGMSTGSVLVIMLLVFSMLYFGGGMLVLKYLRGAEGQEMIPNYDFWVDLPYLVRDGVLFALGGFDTATSYDRI